MVKWGVPLLIVGIALITMACISPYENNLAKKQEWSKLGTYHGEQGYSAWSEPELVKQGALLETDYEKYRAGYTQGRLKYCSNKREVNTIVNADYPDDCDEKSTRTSLSERGY